MAKIDTPQEYASCRVCEASDFENDKDLHIRVKAMNRAVVALASTISPRYPDGPNWQEKSARCQKHAHTIVPSVYRLVRLVCVRCNYAALAGSDYCALHKKYERAICRSCKQADAVVATHRHSVDEFCPVGVPDYENGYCALCAKYALLSGIGLITLFCTDPGCTEPAILATEKCKYHITDSQTAQVVRAPEQQAKTKKKERPQMAAQDKKIEPPTNDIDFRAEVSDGLWQAGTFALVDTAREGLARMLANELPVEEREGAYALSYRMLSGKLGTAIVSATAGAALYTAKIYGIEIPFFNAETVARVARELRVLAVRETSITAFEEFIVPMRAVALSRFGDIINGAMKSKDLISRAEKVSEKT